MSVLRVTTRSSLSQVFCPQQGILYAVLITFERSFGVLAQKERLPISPDVFLSR